MILFERTRESRNSLHCVKLCCTMEIRKRLSDMRHMQTLMIPLVEEDIAYGIDERYFGGLRRVCGYCQQGAE